MTAGELVVRVRYPEVDRMNVAHHMHFLTWMEMGRTEWMRSAGVPYGVLEDRDGLRFPVTEVQVSYHRAARYDEELNVRTALSHADRIRVRFEYEVSRHDENGLLATGHSVHACVRRDGRPTRMPKALLARLTAC